MPRVCCICNTRSSRRFTLVINYEEFLYPCFGLNLAELNGDRNFLCEGCRKAIFLFRGNQKVTFNSRVNSQRGTFTNKRARRKSFMKFSRENPSCATTIQLVNLPNEVLLNILLYLQPLDINSLGLTCKHLNMFSTQEVLWKKMCHREFSQLSRENCFDLLANKWRSTYRVLEKVYSSLINVVKYPVDANHQDLNDELEKKEYEVKQLECTLAGLLDKSENEPTSSLQEKIFRAVLHKKQKQSQDGFVRAKNPHGRPVVLAPVRWPEVSSDLASKRTIRERSKKQEDLIEATSTTIYQPDIQKKEAIQVQIVSLINRDKESYSECAKKAGLKIFGQFTLDQSTALRKEMPFELWRLVKRVLFDVAGRDVMGSETKLREHLEESYFEYECGTFETFENGVSKTVTFVRCTSLRQVLLKTMEQLRQSNELVEHECIPSDTLKILLCGDKGSKQTKLMMTVLNSKLQHSVKRSKLLAMFEGAKDSSHCIKMVCLVLLFNFIACIACGLGWVFLFHTSSYNSRL